MVERIEFFGRAAKAVELFKTLAFGAPVNIDGDVDVIGAYGYCFDRDCQEAIDQLIAGRKTLNTDARCKLAAAASERATETIYGDAGAGRIVRALIVCNDLLGPTEAPAKRRERVYAAIAFGQVMEIE